MKTLLIKYIDAVIPLAFALWILVAPQSFTKKDLKAAENQPLAKRFKIIGWVLVLSGVLMIVAEIGQGWK